MDASNRKNGINTTIKSFVFGDLPSEEKLKFLEFMINNNVEFNLDPVDHMYVATIKIVNK